MKSFMDIWHRNVRVRDTPGRYVDAALSPSIPRWNYLPSGPFQLIRIDPDDVTLMYGYDDQPTLDLILPKFVHLHLPRNGQMCVILDLDHQVVLGWLHNDDGCIWTGCERAFLELERYTDPLDVAWWRDSALKHHLAWTMEGPQ